MFRANSSADWMPLKVQDWRWGYHYEATGNSAAPFALNASFAALGSQSGAPTHPTWVSLFSDAMVQDDDQTTTIDGTAISMS